MLTNGAKLPNFAFKRIIQRIRINHGHKRVVAKVSARLRVNENQINLEANKALKLAIRRNARSANVCSRVLRLLGATLMGAQSGALQAGLIAKFDFGT